MSNRRYVVRHADVEPYSPANHDDTVNRRLIGRENVGATQLEVVLGTVEKGGGALKHSHPGIEQVCYVLEGRARVEIGDEAVASSARETPSSSPPTCRTCSRP